MTSDETPPPGVQPVRAKPLILASSRGPMPIIPSTFEDVIRIANAVVASGLAPKGVTRVEQATIIIMHGLEVGLAPMVALQSIAVINGKPSLYGDGALGVVRASGLLEKFSEKLVVDGGGIVTGAICTVKRRGEPSLARSFSIDDAEKAGLLNKDGPWKTYPNRMLAMRARAFALRDGFADVLKGLGIREEMEDVVPDLDLVPPPPPPPEERMTPLEAAIAKAKEANREIKTDDQGLVIWDETTERPATAEDARP